MKIGLPSCQQDIDILISTQDPFYANMFSNAGFQITSDQKVPDALVDNLVISGNEEKVAARINELLSAGLDELMVSPVPVTGTGEDSTATGTTHAFDRSAIMWYTEET